MEYQEKTFQFGPAGLTKTVKWLLLVNVGVFVLQYIAGGTLVQIFGLTPVLVKSGYIWQLFTYMFLHGGIWHILFNLFALWMFGCEIERVWGAKEFLRYYFICGVGAGIFNFLLSLNSTIPTIGASGAIFGILVAYALMFPNRIVYLYFLFPIKVKYLVIIFALIEFLFSWRNTPDGIGHFAHLGGMLIGFLYIKLDWKIPYLFKIFKEWKYRKKLQKLNKIREKNQRVMERVDEILDKINQVGMGNLTKEEKKILEEASHLLTKKEGKKQS
jgi:membrane associated rhomboid family serine protease